MVKNAWKNSHFFCNECKSEMILVEESGGKYRCPECSTEVGIQDVFILMDKMYTRFDKSCEEDGIGSIVGETVNINKRVFGTVTKERYDGGIDMTIKVIKRR